MNIPAHMWTSLRTSILDGGENVDTYDANLLVSPAVVIDISARVAEDADAFVDCWRMFKLGKARRAKFLPAPWSACIRAGRRIGATRPRT